MVGRRGGFALMELVVGSALLLFVVQTSWWVVAAHAKAATAVVDGSRALDAARITRHILTSEIRQGGSSGDFTVTDSEVHLRAFRGVAIFCQGEGDVWWVNTSGVRNLDVAKDSLLTFTPEAGWQVGSVRTRARGDSGRCPQSKNFHEERWVLEKAVDGPIAARYFERGAYRFSDGAFRTLQGRGWQPITEVWLDDGGSGIWARPPDGLSATLRWGPPSPFSHAVSWVSWATR